MSKISLIGPRANKLDPSKTGGVIVLFENLIYQFQEKGTRFIVVDTNKANYPNIAIALLLIYVKIFFAAFKSDHLSIHGTAKDYLYIAPFVVLLSKILGKKSSTRKFAGNFNSYYEQSSPIKKRLIEYVLKHSHFNFFETKYLVKFFKPFNQNTFWFPNVREKNDVIKTKPFEKRFVFISQLYETKGVNEILQASNLLSDEYTIDFYGPLRDHYTKSYFDDYKANYKGSLNPNKVIETLEQYDVLMLPTYYPGEGYPGIVIEALSVGKPVIVTDLESIKEMVDQRSAIFVKPRNIEDLKNAIIIFNEGTYINFSSNALNCFEQFDSDIQTSKFLKIIMDKE